MYTHIIHSIHIHSPNPPPNIFMGASMLIYVGKPISVQENGIWRLRCPHDTELVTSRPKHVQFL